MRIAIYVNNESISDIECIDLTKGNPGIGGTEYSILLMAQIYQQYYPQNQVTLFVSSEGMLPPVESVIVVSDVIKLPEKAIAAGVDMLIISAVDNGEPLPAQFFRQLEKHKLKTIIWGHNFYLSDFCNRLANCPYVMANVFVGRQQYDRYVDHRVIRKSTYIYNMYPQVDKVERKQISNHSVTYIGSLVPTKGFHILAGAWKQILKQVPDATLNVIGNGKLYGRDSRLGKYGIADETYENQFMPGLLNDQGKMLPSVHFLGLLGADKDKTIVKTTVGIVNPTGRTETFGISALDFESIGVPVVTIAKGGFLDTVIDKQTGLFFSSTDGIADTVVSLLLDEERNLAYGNAARNFAQNFEPSRIIGAWDELFRTVYDSGSLQYYKPDNFMKSNLKWLRCVNRNAKDALHMEYPFSVIALETVARKLQKKLGI